jgi:hypothetical protein
MLTLNSPSPRSIPTDSWRKSDIAIVGMSVDIPGSEDLHEFWDMLQNSRDVSSQVIDSFTNTSQS